MVMSCKQARANSIMTRDVDPARKEDCKNQCFTPYQATSSSFLLYAHYRACMPMFTQSLWTDHVTLFFLRLVPRHRWMAHLLCESVSLFAALLKSRHFVHKTKYSTCLIYKVGVWAGWKVMRCLTLCLQKLHRVNDLNMRQPPGSYAGSPPRPWLTHSICSSVLHRTKY